MTLNCKAGDLAVVISDEPGCEDNIGRIVKVLGPSSLFDANAGWWSIQPVDQQPWTCIQPIQGGKWVEVFRSSGRVSIEDRCLRPIRGVKPADQVRVQRARVTPAPKLSVSE